MLLRFVMRFVMRHADVRSDGQGGNTGQTLSGRSTHSERVQGAPSIPGKLRQGPLTRAGNESAVGAALHVRAERGEHFVSDGSAER